MNPIPEKGISLPVLVSQHGIVSFLPGSDVPFVLVIDEANALKILAENDYSVRTDLELWTDADLVLACSYKHFAREAFGSSWSWF